MAKEEKIPNYIDFPYEIFLMLRLEFLALCQDEVEAKIMRIIEKAVNDEWESIYRERCATTPKNKPVEMPEEVWVVIPNRYFLDRLLGTVQSESTLKATMKSLVQEKKLVFRHERPGRYDAPEYTLNKKALVEFFATLPSDPRQVDMMAIMKQERKNSKKKDDQEGQKLTPSKIDPLVTERVKNWLPQKLTPSASKIDPLVERGGGQKLTPTYIPLDNNLDDKSKSITANADDATPSPSFANGEDDGTNNANTASLQSDHHSSVNGVTVRVDVRHSEEVNGQSTSTENAENNRLTSTPESLPENISSTDESPLRIASETANETPSSPVIEPATDEMIHADARKDGDSYSPQSTTIPETIAATEQPESDEMLTPTEKGVGKGKGGRKKSDAPTAEQYRKVFDTMNEAFRRIHQKPDFKIPETKSAKEAVRSLIEAKGNPALLKLTMFDMWNEMDSRSEHWWRKPGRMTIKAIVEQYTSRAPGLASKLPNHAATKNEVVKDALNENTLLKPPVVVPSPLGAYSSRPELQPWKDDGAVSDEALNRPSWAAIKKQRKQAAGGR